MKLSHPLPLMVIRVHPSIKYLTVKFFFQKFSLRQCPPRLAKCFLSAKSREKLTAHIARAYLCRCQGSKEKAHAGQIPDDD